MCALIIHYHPSIYTERATQIGEGLGAEKFMEPESFCARAFLASEYSAMHAATEWCGKSERHSKVIYDNMVSPTKVKGLPRSLWFRPINQDVDFSSSARYRPHLPNPMFTQAAQLEALGSALSWGDKDDGVRLILGSDVTNTKGKVGP